MKTFYCTCTFFLLLFSSFIFSVNATVHPFSVVYSGTQEVPPTGSAGTGTISGTYDDATNTISYSITFSGLGSNTTAAHFHGPAAPGIATGVTFAHTGFPTGVTSGSLVGPVTHVLTAQQETDLLAGLWYSNIHTTGFPGGEIRAQIFFTTTGNVVPDITCPSDTTVSSGLDTCGRSVAFNPATATGTPTPVISYRINTTVITSPHVFPVGTTTVKAIALSGAGVDSCTFTVTVNDVQDPQITCPANIVQGNDPGQCGAVVSFTIPATDNCPGVITNSVPASGTFFPVGTTTVNATATDASGNTSTCSFTVTVNDVEPPVISNISASPDHLWPPNHKLRNVVVNYTSTDNCGVDTCTLSVASNEAVNAYGSGNTSPDWIVIDNHLVKLRSERTGHGNGRIYTITISCSDVAGNTGTGTQTVTVAHDQGNVTARTLTFGEDGSPRGLYAIATPNPSRNYFTLHIETDNAELINVRVSDVMGRIVESKTNLSGSQILRIGNNLKAGIYFVELRQGSETQYMKLLKQ